MTRTALGLVLALAASAGPLITDAQTRVDTRAETTSPADAAESARAVLTANHAAAIASPTAPTSGALRLTYAFDGMGLKGQATSLVDLADGRFVDALSAGPVNQTQGFDGATGWVRDASGAVIAQDGAEPRALARNDAYRRANLWWRDDRAGATIEFVGRRRDPAGGAYDVIAVTPKGGLRFEAWFDATSHLLSRISEKQGPATITTSYADYRPVSGLMVAGRMNVDDGEGAKYVQSFVLTDASIAAATPADSAFAAPRAEVADFAIDGGQSRTVIPFELINNHIYAQGAVNGKGPFRFIFDTGGTELVTPTLARTIGLNVQGDFDAHGAGEGVMSAGFAKVDELKVGGARTRGEVFAVLPLDALTDVEGVEEQGMVGFQTFRRFVTRVDYGAHTITLIDPKAFDPADAGTPIPFTFADTGVEIAGAFEGIPGRFRIDTGARDELTLNRPFVERNGLRASHPGGVEAVDGWGVGGPSRAYVMRGRSLKLGPVEVTGVVTDAAIQAKGAFAGDDNQGNIGGGVLKRFVVTFDYGHQIMYLKPLAGPVADAGTYDRAGMWFNRAPEGFKLVDITAGGPAATAGLKPGDLITEVDGAPARELGLADLRRRLRNEAPGTRLRLAVLRDGQPIRVEVTLRDLIS